MSASDIQDFEAVQIAGGGILQAVDDAFLACVRDACGHEGHGMPVVPQPPSASMWRQPTPESERQAMAVALRHGMVTWEDMRRAQGEGPDEG